MSINLGGFLVMNIKFVDFINTLDFGAIDMKRKVKLMEYASLFTKELKKNGELDLSFICTHNSRRSHMAQMIAIGLIKYLHIKHTYCYSGGTEVAEIYPTTLVALKDIGFEIKKVNYEEEVNPRYKIIFNEKTEITAFSKLYNDQSNPQANFIAIMVCSEAEKNCPVVQGANHRITLNYEDPKEFDGTENELKAYIDKCHEIGNELYFILILMKKALG